MKTDINEASTSLRQTVEQYKSKAQTIAVTSGKGGVGKSSIAANLAMCLSASGNKVLLVDADLSLGNLDLIMDINSRYNISHLLYGGKTIEQIVQIGPDDVEIICSASGFENLANINLFEQNRLVSDLKKVYEGKNIILIDTAAGISKSVINFCIGCEQTLVLTTPQPTAISDAYALIKVLNGNKYQGRICLVVNMAQNMAEGRKIYRQIAGVAGQFLNRNIYEAGVIIKDEKVDWAIRQKRPVVLAYPKARITQNISAIAAKLSNCPAGNPNQERFFRKVVDWFF